MITVYPFVMDFFHYNGKHTIFKYFLIVYLFALYPVPTKKVGTAYPEQNNIKLQNTNHLKNFYFSNTPNYIKWKITKN